MRQRSAGLLAMAHAAALLAGCNDIENAITILGGIAPTAGMGTGGCLFDAAGMKTFSYTFDAASQETLSIGLAVRNNLQGGMVPFAGTGAVPDDFIIPNGVNPTRMDIRWECDSNGFADDVGSLFLPQFSVENPFCIDEDTREFSGFDVISATGATILPGEVGGVMIRPVPQQLGQAFEDVFTLARLADDCCTAAGASCNDADLQAAASQTACVQLQRVFDTVAGTGRLSAQSFADLQKFRPFTAYDRQRTPPKAGQGIGPSFPMRLRGVLEGVTGDGSVVSSSEFSLDVGVCSGCEPSGDPCEAF